MRIDGYFTINQLCNATNVGSCRVRRYLAYPDAPKVSIEKHGDEKSNYFLKLYPAEEAVDFILRCLEREEVGKEPSDSVLEQRAKQADWIGREAVGEDLALTKHFHQIVLKGIYGTAD